MYVFVRKDLSHPQQVVQACHAAIESSRHFISLDSEHPSVIVCGVRDESNLWKIHRRLERLGVQFRDFYEPDIDNQLTAIASSPISGANRETFKHYQLLQEGGVL